MDLEALKKEFLARGGQVQRVQEGERAIESDRAIYRAMRDGKRIVADDVARARAMEAKAERQAEAFRAAKYDGWSNDEAHIYSQEAK